MFRWAGPLLVGIGLGAAGAWIYLASGRAASISRAGETASASGSAQENPPGKRAVFALGTIQPREGAVLVSSTHLGAIIRAIPVREGQWVEAGDLLIELDPTLAQQELRTAESQRRQAEEEHQGKVLAARHRVEAARLALSQAQAARKSEPESQRKQLDAARLKVEQAQAELKRLETLSRGNPQAVSSAQIEQQRGVVRLAEAERDAAESALSRLEQSLVFALEKADGERRAAEQTLQLLERAGALLVFDDQVRLAQAKVDDHRITAPQAGTIIAISAQVGERVTAQPLLQIANLKTLKCEAEVDVADIPLLRDRKEAFLTSQAFRGARVPATVERIGNVAAAATLRPVDPRKAVDRTVASVVLGVDAAEARRLLGTDASGAGTVLMGLQVDVEIPIDR